MLADVQAAIAVSAEATVALSVKRDASSSPGFEVRAGDLTVVGVDTSSFAYSVGLRDGCKIIKVDNGHLVNFDSYEAATYVASACCSYA